eukprot:5721823-Pyramimonas_sp.AAC.1
MTGLRGGVAGAAVVDTRTDSADTERVVATRECAGIDLTRAVMLHASAIGSRSGASTRVRDTWGRLPFAPYTPVRRNAARIAQLRAGDATPTRHASIRREAAVPLLQQPILQQTLHGHSNTVVGVSVKSLLQNRLLKKWHRGLPADASVARWCDVARSQLRNPRCVATDGCVWGEWQATPCVPYPG